MSVDREEDYRRSLAKLDPYTRQVLLDGDWDAKPPEKMFRIAKGIGFCTGVTLGLLARLPGLAEPVARFTRALYLWLKHRGE